MPESALRFALIVIGSAIMQGCGGGSGGGGSGADPQPPPPPVIDTTAPTMPGNIMAAAVNSSRVDVSWSASTDSGGSNLAGYRLYRDGATTALATVNAPATSYSDTGLTASTQYSYIVRAVDGAGNESAASAAATATTPQIPSSVDTTPPTAPSNPAARAQTSSRIDVSWGASTDAGGSGLAGYRIYRDGATTALTTVDAVTTTYSNNGLAASTQYSYIVRAVDGAGNESTPSPAAIATTLEVPPAATSGLDTRPSNPTCLAWNRPTTGAIALERFTNLSFNASVAMLQAPADNSSWYVVEQGGIVKRFTAANPAGVANFINLTTRVTSGGEAGLLGMAFHPNFPADNRVFLSYTVRVGTQLESRISSFLSNDQGITLDADSETVLMRVNQPEDNHNGGNIAFGPDGFLYIGFGDGGGGGDTYRNGQRLTTLLGKMLRIDVNGAPPYQVPTTNPFYNPGNAADKCLAAGRSSGNCPEIYAWGLRNPWRWSFDRGNGDLWVADVGQNAWEEVNVVARGGNYGWRCREGAHDFDTAGTPECAGATLIDPVAEYDRNNGTAITGGYVYRGTQATNLSGRYIFGDSGSGNIWAWIAEQAAQPRQPTLLLGNTGLSIVSFGQGNDGELYAVAYGSLHRIVFQPPGAAGGTAPVNLSATGCVKPGDAKQPIDGLIPYGINAPFWSDGALKDRWMGLPDGTQITVQPNGDWDFPNRTVLMKNFSIGTRLIETRLFMRHPDGNWGGFTYAWNAQQTDATLVSGGAVRDIGNGQQWIFPSESQCMQCHTHAAGAALGPETAQLNRGFAYPQPGRTANQLFTLNHIGLLAPPISDPAAQPALPDPSDTAAPLADRARAWLHTNCSQCHQPGGPTQSTMDLRYTTVLNQTNACNVLPRLGNLGLGPDSRLIAPGSAVNSIVLNRTQRRDANAMPPVGSNQVDAAGVALLSQWINGLTGC